MTKSKHTGWYALTRRVDKHTTEVAQAIFRTRSLAQFVADALTNTGKFGWCVSRLPESAMRLVGLELAKKAKARK